MENTDFTPRMKQIILALLANQGPVPVQRLAEQVHISKRTVQRELEYFPRALKKYDIAFCSKTGTGVWVEGSSGSRERLKAELEAEDILDVSDRAERQKRLILEILKDKKLKKLYYYSNLFGVSEATVSSDLEAARGWLHRYGLEIIRKPGYGVLIEGNEAGFRKALKMFIDENINSDIIQEIYENRSQSVMDVISDKSERNIYRILDDGIVKRVTTCILRIRDRRILNLTRDSYLGLVIHVATAVNRIQKQEIIEENPDMTDKLHGDSDYMLAQQITGALEEEFNISIPEVECAYICLHIKGSKIQQLKIDEKSRAEIEESRELWDVVNEMIDCYDSDIACLLKQDEDFVIQGLIAHLKPTLIRLANGMKIENPLLEQIKKDYSAIFERCRKVAEVIERRYGYHVPEPEIGFLAIHFGAAEVRLESRKEYRRKVDVGIVCASGIGISRLMSSKISRAFADRVQLSAYGIADLTPYVLKRNDFLVSSMALKEEADILYVSPLLPPEDMEKIARKVRQYEYVSKKADDEAFTAQLDQVNRLAVRIKGIIRQMGYHKVNNEITFEEMLIAVSEELTPYADRRLLIQEDLKRREQLGSQIFPDFGIALFHARTHGVGKPVFSVCQTRDGNPFQASEFQGICAALVMLVPDDDEAVENSSLLGVLSERLVEEDGFLESVKHGQKEDIKRYVSMYLNQYFKQYLDKI